jgi:hypothetical protein
LATAKGLNNALGASGRSPTKRFVEDQVASPSSWKTPRMAEGLLRVVGREQHGQCSSLGKPTDGIENPHLVAEIEARSQLIED